MPWFILIAGPNGAGKSTLTSSREFQQRANLFPAGNVRLLNPDEVAKAYFETHPEASLADADAYAANAVPTAVERCIQNGEDVAVETVLSSDKYEPIIQLAHQKQYKVGMIYLALGSAAVSVARVQKRVASGGHPAPQGKLRDRWRRSLERLVKFAPVMDALHLYLSTSAEGLTLLAQKHEGRMVWYGGRRFPRLRKALGAEPPRELSRSKTPPMSRVVKALQHRSRRPPS